MATVTLSKLKTDMLFNQDLQRLVDVMKGVAAAQFHVMERKLTGTGKLTKALDELFEVYDFRVSNHPFLKNKNGKKLICVVTTDSGFLGGLNMKVIQAAMSHETKGSHYMVIGDRGVNYLKEFGKSYLAFPGINTDDSRYRLLDKVCDSILSRIRKGDFGRVILSYPRCLSFTTQRVETLNLIPCPIFFKSKSENILPAELQAKDVILESAPDGVIEMLTTIWLRRRLIEVFETAKMSEFGARTMHLEESFQTLTKLNKKLKLEFFKARREKIDQSLRETFTSQLMSHDKNKDG